MVATSVVAQLVEVEVTQRDQTILLILVQTGPFDWMPAERGREFVPAPIRSPTCFNVFLPLPTFRAPAVFQPCLSGDDCGGSEHLSFHPELAASAVCIIVAVARVTV